MAFAVETQYGQRDELKDDLILNKNGNVELTFEFPDDGILRKILVVHLELLSIATMMTSPEIYGPSLMLERGGNRLGWFGMTRWLVVASNRLEAYVWPGNEYSAIVQPTDEMKMFWLETDVNATPTGDLKIRVECLRIRGGL